MKTSDILFAVLIITVIFCTLIPAPHNLFIKQPKKQIAVETRNGGTNNVGSKAVALIGGKPRLIGYSNNLTAIGYRTSDNLVSSYQNTAYDFPVFNICIGRFAGYLLTTEKYCLIISSDSIGKNIIGKDMIWYVDYDQPIFKKYPDLKALLKSYDRKNETVESRIRLMNKVKPYLYKRSTD